ncbi:MAG: glycosyltransferase [Bacteroidetes bacterium]|nr:MAG: glycosyltransferase [Bacteroidota bacterium]
MLIFITFCLASYAIFTVLLYIFWQKIRIFSFPASPTSANLLKITVIIPVRNEARNIRNLLEDLERQTLSPAGFEVWVIDDESEDDTAQIVQSFRASYSLHLLPSDKALAHLSPKKRAIQTALAHTAGKLIVCTDGDCRVGKDWLRLFAEYQHVTGAHWISGGVAFDSPTLSWWATWQAVEFSSLVGSGAITLAYGLPTMANGANLAYTREAFDAVAGFAGNEHLASGDDEFLLHKIAEKYPTKVFFLKNPAHTVYTLPQATARDFYAQRKRWGSKWAHYKNVGIKLLAVAIFGANLAFLGALLGFALGLFGWQYFALQASLKLLPEFCLLYSFSRYFFRASVSPFFIPFVQLTYPFYVVFFGLVSLVGKGYVWKGRRLQ